MTQHFCGPWEDKHFHLPDQQYRDNGWFPWFGPELESLPVTGDVYQGQWPHIWPIVLSGSVALIVSSFHPTGTAWWINIKNYFSEHPMDVMPWTCARNTKFWSLRMKFEKAHKIQSLSYALWATSTWGSFLIFSLWGWSYSCISTFL